MVESNRYTIIVNDKQVYLDNWVYHNLDFSDCGIPDDIHALQFRNGSGWIEYRDTRPNPELNSVADFPDWAVKCIAKWEEQYILNPPPANP